MDTACFCEGLCPDYSCDGVCYLRLWQAAAMLCSSSIALSDVLRHYRIASRIADQQALAQNIVRVGRGDICSVTPKHPRSVTCE